MVLWEPREQHSAVFNEDIVTKQGVVVTVNGNTEVTLIPNVYFSHQGLDVTFIYLPGR